MSRLERLKNLVFKLNVAALVFLCVFGVVELVAWQLCRMLVSAHRQMREPSYLEAYAGCDWAEEHLRNLRESYLSLRYQPYYLWGLSEVQTSTYNVTADWGGIRKTVNPPKPSPRRKVKVFLFGGSTVFCSRVPDRCTIASHLSARLNRRFEDVEFTVLNLGRGGFVNDQEIVWLTQILTAGEVPDVVIFYDGVNDVINKVCQGVPHFRYELFRSLEIDRGGDMSVLEALRQYEYVGKLARLLAGQKTDPRQYVTDPAALQQNAEQMAARYRQNAAFVRRLGEAYGFRAVFFWQPGLLTTKKKLTREESDILEGDALTPVHRAGFEVADRWMKEIAAEEDDFYDATDVLDGLDKSVFFDICHVSDAANEAIAERIAETLIAGGYLKDATALALSLHEEDAQ